MNETIHENLAYGIALRPTTLVAGAGAVNGADTISNPAATGRQLGILLILGAQTGVTAFNVEIQGSNDNGATWTSVKANDGVTPLAFTGAAYIAAGAQVNKVTLGTLPILRAPYKDYRLGNMTCTGANCTIQAAFVILPVRNKPAGGVGGQTDAWLNSALPAGS